jgi:molecular chaperone DnaJ
MAHKDYYWILGVSRSETPSAIRARYRDLARRFHPDVAGPQSTSTFQEITEAYEILADPAARRRYNAELARLERRPPVEGFEPLAASRREPVSLFAEPRAGRPSFEALMDRLFRSFTGVGVPKAERPEGLTVEVILTAEEALRGVTVPIGVPGLEPCPHCGGTGRVWMFPCGLCGAAGSVASDHVVRVTIPPRIQSRSIIETPVYGLGIDNLYLRLYIRVE